MGTFNSRTHGILDYFIGFLIFTSPLAFDLEEETIHCRILVITGLLLFLNSFMTDFEFFLVKAISFENHLRIDFILGLFLLLSPLFFDLSQRTILPHITLGISLITVNLLSKTQVEKSKNFVPKDKYNKKAHEK